MDRFIEDRLSLFKELIESGGFRGGAPWGLEPSMIRFVLSKSLREMKIPYFVGTDDLDTIEKALFELMYLMKERLENSEAVDGGMGLSADSIGVLKTLPERSYKMDLFQEGSMQARIAEYVLVFIPLIDGGILYGWFGNKGKGRGFIGLLKEIYLKALEEAVKTKGKEPTAYLAHIAVLNSIKVIKNRLLRKIAIKGVSYERWEYSIGILLFFVIDTIVKDALKDFVKSHPLYNLQKTGFVLKSSLTPWSFLSIKDVVTTTPINPYYMTSELINGFLPFHESIVDESKTLDGLVEEILVRAKKDRGLTESAIKIEKVRRFRACIFDYISRYTNLNMDIYEGLERAFRDSRILQNILFDERLKREWVTKIERLKKQFASDEKRIETLSSIENFLRTTKKGWLPGILGGRLGNTDQNWSFVDTIRRFLAYRFDEEVERCFAPRKSILVDRREEFVEKEVMREYEKGRVYLISSDKRVILKELGISKEGQLYIDMKDFTRKTFRVKEVTMADFMRKHFYKPILEAAGIYAIGRQMMEDSASISLQNLLGDAIIYSGNISSLVSLAEDIQGVMDKYKRELELRLRSLNIKDPLAGIKERYESLKEELVRKKKPLQKKLEAGEAMDVSEWMEILDREKDIERAFHEEVDEARGREMDAGLFISYGAKAENIHLKDDLWGEKEVAIGEKINEASRGSNRNRLIRMGVERLLEDARKMLRNPRLSLPFDVYIGKTYSLRMDHESASAIDMAVVHRDVSRAETLTKVFASRLFMDLRDTIDNRSLVSSRYITRERKIYNKGHALSGEALRAFIHDTESYMQHFNRKVCISDLGHEIRKKFFFTENPLELWFSIRQTEHKTLIFRKVGKLVFKGFESGGATTVYEMLKRDSEFYIMIIEHHFNEWLSEVKPNNSLRLPDI